MISIAIQVPNQAAWKLDLIGPPFDVFRWGRGGEEDGEELLNGNRTHGTVTPPILLPGQGYPLWLTLMYALQLFALGVAVLVL
jgi:hypothetical protein